MTVTVDEDEDAVADADVTIAHALDGAAEYATLSADTVRITIQETDTQGVTISPTELTVGEGASETYTVVLDSQPTEDVIIRITGQTGTDLTLSRLSLTFSPESWNQAQTVTVNAAEDGDAVDDAVTLSHDASGGDYDQVSSQAIAVAVTDNDPAGVTIHPTALTVAEGGSKRLHGEAGHGAFGRRRLWSSVTRRAMTFRPPLRP